LAISEWRIERLEMDLHTAKLHIEEVSVILARVLHGIELDCAVKTAEGIGTVVKLGVKSCWVKLPTEPYSKEMPYVDVEPIK